jgi:predicted DNA-binding protein
MGRNKKITNGVKVSFYVPNTWHELMKNLADNNATTIAELYRQAVKEYIERHKPNPDTTDT